MRRLVFGLLFCAAPAWAEAPRVSADIAPVHSLVAMVMEGVGTPDLIIPPGASPHDHAMRPSEAAALADAQFVVWIGEALTPWLEAPIDSLAGQATVLELMHVDGVTALEVREAGVFESHDHDHDHGHGHEGDENTDPHMWLDPDNAQVWLAEIAAQLGAIDPENATTYRENAARSASKITALETEIAAQLADVEDGQFVVLHDGFHYFEAHFEVEAFAAVSGNDADAPGAVRIANLREGLRTSGVQCAFSEPQMDPKLLKTVTEGLGVKGAVIDPLGADIDLGTTQYLSLLTSISGSISGCVTP